MDYYGGDNEETIYKIVQKEIPPPPRPPMYRSQHPGSRAPSCSTFRIAQTSKPGVQNMSGEDIMNCGGAHEYVKPSATFGPPPGVSKPDPVNFMTSSQRTGVLSAEEVRKHHPELLQPSNLKPRLRPSVPRKEEKPIMHLVSEKNYIIANAVEAILAAPKKVAVEPQNWINRPAYGEVPQYLGQIKKDISAEYEYIQRLQEEEEEARSNKVQLLPQEKKEELIEGLKAKWEQTNREYQASTHLTKLDTINKIKRKEKNEAELAELEKNIQKLTKASIFVDTTK
eukprot:GEMP01031647.1.p1 GENE.GEMP01031647.1~~GEMP01031647.1.p1  ORF type:complete len:315 (+),score=66.36 GEMP01031647.1:98-946(+)